MFGALGSTPGHNFYKGTQNGSTQGKCWSQIFDSHLLIRDMALWVSPICLYREAIHLQCLLREWVWPT